MRVAQENGPFRVRGISGTRVVLMAWDLDKAARQGLRGFAIKYAIAGSRDQPQWLTGTRYFEATAGESVPGTTFSSREQPFQTFLWSDYKAHPGTRYAFTVVALYGEPGHLTEGYSVEFEIATEKENDGKHGIWFNFGAIASHALAANFNNRKLTAAMVNDVDENGVLRNEEVAWLSRGLTEACLAFINSARPGEGLRVCAYEFTYQPLLLALKRAMERKVDVQIIYHFSKKPGDDNLDAITAAGVPATDDATNTPILFQRTRISIPHNKFIVKLVDGSPVAVWTGSTNFTDTGFFGQTNVGHLVTDGDVAAKYLAYWTLVKDDLTHKPMVAATAKLTANPANAISPQGIVPFYSPRIADNMLDWYAARIKDARSFVGITIPFDVAPAILAGLDDAKDSLRLAILEDKPAAEVKAAERRNSGRLAFSNGSILGKTLIKSKKYGGATMAPIANTGLDQWFIGEELARPINNGYVFFIHCKFMMVDPLSDDPLICSGSANFSSNSLSNNDENMLLIRGDIRVADIYFTEFDRIFRHFYARNAINQIAARGNDHNPLALDPGFDWIERNYKPGLYKNTRRLVFFPDAAPAETWAERALGDPDPFSDEIARAKARRVKKPPLGRTIQAT